MTVKFLFRVLFFFAGDGCIYFILAGFDWWACNRTWAWGTGGRHGRRDKDARGKKTKKVWHKMRSFNEKEQTTRKERRRTGVEMTGRMWKNMAWYELMGNLNRGWLEVCLFWWFLQRTDAVYAIYSAENIFWSVKQRRMKHELVWTRRVESSKALPIVGVVGDRG